MTTKSARTWPIPPMLVAVLFAVLAALSVAPVFWVLLPPLNDYPNHLARMHILTDLGQSPYLSRFYRNVMAAQPNLAMDLIVPVLAKSVSLQLAGKIFIALTAILTAAGTLALHRSLHRKLSIWPLTAFFFVFHRMMLWGLLNYCFGLGVMLVALALWLAVREKPVILRLFVSSISAVAMYISHLYAFGIFAIALGGIELWYLFSGAYSLRTKVRNIVVAGVPFLIPAYLFLFHSGPSASDSGFRWSSLLRKLEAPFDVIFQYHLAFDAGCFLAFALLFGWGLWKRRISFDQRMTVSLGLLVAAFLAMPDELFTGFGADRRLPIAILLILISATDWQPARAVWREPAVVLLGALFLLRTMLLADVWHRSDAVYAQYFAAFERVPRGAKILPYTLQPETRSLQPIPLLEGACLGIVLRDAFVPSLFTSPPLSSESVSFAPSVLELGLKTHFHILRGHDVAALHRKKIVSVPAVFRPEILSQFDYVFITRPDALRPGILPMPLQTVYRGSTFVLLKVPHPLGAEASQ